MRLRVLLVDDKESFKELVATKIQESNQPIDLTWVDSPHKIPSEKFDLYLVDNRYHGVDLGIEAIAKIRDVCRNSIIYVASAHSGYEFVKQLLKEHVDGFVDKNDMSFKDLFEVADRLLKKKQLREKMAVQLDQAKQELE